MKEDLKKTWRVHGVKTARQLLIDQSDRVLKGIPTHIFNEWLMKQSQKKQTH